MPTPDHPPHDRSHGIALPMLLVLGGLTALPPLSFDMYLPALPDIATDYGVAESQIQLTLSSCLIGLALGQLFGGPISDALGRRRPLVAGIIGYSVLCLACAAAPSASLLIGLRFLMGLFGGVAVVISRAIVRDRATGAEAAHTFSLLMLVGGAAPIVAPVVGGLLIEVTSWRGIFVVLAGLGGAGLLAVLVVLPETLTADRRRSGGVRDTLSVVVRVARDRTFMGYALTSAFAFGVLFFYISSSSFVFQDVYDLSPQGFSAVFAGNAIGLVVFGQLNAVLVRRFAPGSLLRWGTAHMAVGAILLVTAVELRLGLPAVIAALVFTNVGLPLVVPNATALALSPYGREAGTASAFLGVLQFAIGALATPLAGVFGETTQFTMAFGMLIMALLALAAHHALVRGEDAHVPGVVVDPSEPLLEPCPSERA
jgi:DHA1 family bicyclomycin/chloramphenicol resistance-like MFS transporter